MRIYRQAGNIKAALFLGGFILIACLFIYTQSIINDLRNESRKTVSIYAQLVATGVTSAGDSELDFIFREIIQKVNFPIIHSDNEGNPLIWRNLENNDSISVEKVKKMMIAMDIQNEPIPLIVTINNESENNDKLEKFELGELHFGDSVLIRRLQLLPYIEIGVVALFIFFGFSGFQLIRNTEKQHLWFGMARETAHQLGTPVSSLMGWIERLKDNPEESLELVSEMDMDLIRLKEISERFSRMGSVPKMEEVSVLPLLKDLKKYFEKRLPQKMKTLTIETSGKNNSVIASLTLLTWALENLIKNSIDSIDDKSGSINLSCEQDGDKVTIIVKDNGKGIPKRDWKNVFRPGYSTKERGWGVGLSMVQRIVQDFLNGSIEIKSSQIGRGTSIEIRLPSAKGN
tara:strand:+ start:14430 stop:15632 length:1203 start_codon:yes stop_codon:yes gene_type:complete